MERKQKFRVVLYIVIAAVIAAAVIFAAARGGMDSTSVLNEKLELGQKYLVELDYSNAVLEFTDAIKIDPKNPDAYIGLAEAYIGTGDTEKAIEALERGYEETGDERIKQMLDELTGDSEAEETEVSETEEVTLPAETTTEAETTVTTEENNGEASDDDVIPMESIYIPYKVNGEMQESLINPMLDFGKENICLSKIDNDFYITYNNGMTKISLGYNNGLFELLGIVNSDSNTLINTMLIFNKRISPKLDIKYSYNSPYIPSYRVYDENNNFLCGSESLYNDLALETERIYYVGDSEVLRKHYVYDDKLNITEIETDSDYVQYGYDNNGNLINIIDKNGTISYSYDMVGNLTEVIKNSGNETTKSLYEYNYDANCISSNYIYSFSNVLVEYDSNGNVIKNTYYFANSDSKVIYTYKYDIKGNITEIYESSGESENELKAKCEYDNNNLIYFEYHGSNDVIRTAVCKYDLNNNITSITISESAVVSDKMVSLYEYTDFYTYDSLGNVIKTERYFDNTKNHFISSEEYEYLRLELPKYILDEFREAAGSRK